MLATGRTRQIRSRPKPTLAFDFMSTGGLSLDSRLTLARANNTATRINASGLVEVVNANLPRYDYNPDTLALRGLLIEGARTNLLNFSQTFATSGGSQNNWVDTNLTRVSTNNPAPDGQNDALRIQASADNGTLISSAAMGTSAQRVFSLWFRRVSGTGAVEYTTNNGSTWTAVALTSSWKRFSFAPTTEQQRVGVRITTSGDTIEVWQAQLEAASFESSDIETTTSTVARSLDSLTTSVIGAPWYNATEGTMVVEATIRGGTAATFPGFAYFYNSADVNGVNRAGLAWTAGTTGTTYLRAGIPDADLADSVAKLAGDTVRLALAYKTNDTQAAFQGRISATDTACTYPSAFINTLGFGIPLRFQPAMHMWLRRFEYFPRRFSAGELITLSME